jgi:hypothetical protein
LLREVRLGLSEDLESRSPRVTGDAGRRALALAQEIADKMAAAT